MVLFYQLQLKEKNFEGKISKENLFSCIILHICLFLSLIQCILDVFIFYTLIQGFYE